MTGPATEPRDDLPALEQLPPAVRARVVALTAQVLPDVPRLPASLRKVATFAVARRARHGGPAILAALDDEDFRDRVGGPGGRPARRWTRHRQASPRGSGWSGRRVAVAALGEALVALEADPVADGRWPRTGWPG